MKKTRKTEFIHVRVSPEGKEIIRRKAESLGVSISDLVSLCLLKSIPELRKKRRTGR